ncbi:hypothetical protein D3C87_2019090 [compost metagenome]
MQPVVGAFLPAAFRSEMMAVRTQNQSFSCVHFVVPVLFTDVETAFPDNQQIKHLDVLAV